jgi:hypothetical protein
VNEVFGPVSPLREEGRNKREQQCSVNKTFGNGLGKKEMLTGVHGEGPAGARAA